MQSFTIVHTSPDYFASYPLEVLLARVSGMHLSRVDRIQFMVQNSTRSYIPESISQSMIPTSSLPSVRVFKLLRSACVKQRGPLCITTIFPTSDQDLPPQESIALDSGTGQSVLWNRSLLQPEVVQSLAVCTCRSYNHWAVECFASPQSCAKLFQCMMF